MALVFGNNLLMGDKIRLTVITKADLPDLTCWFSDLDYVRLVEEDILYPATLESTADWYESMQKKANQYSFAMRTLTDNQLLGRCSLRHINWQAQHGELGLGIGNPDMRGQGYGSDTLRILLKYAFMELHLNRVYLKPFSYNETSIRVYEKIGFRHEARYREAMYRDGRYYDVLVLGILYDEWATRYRLTQSG